MAKIYLKEIELDDLNILSVMIKDFWKTQIYEASKSDILDDIRKFLSKKSCSYLIVYEDNIAGFIYVNEKYGYLNNIEYLYVRDEFRGKGLGKFALTKIKEILLSRGEHRVQIEVNPAATSNIKLYHDLGFDNIDTITLSTNIIGEKEDIEMFGMTFKVNKAKLFKKKYRDE